MLRVVPFQPLVNSTRKIELLRPMVALVFLLQQSSILLVRGSLHSRLRMKRDAIFPSGKNMEYFRARKN